MKDMWREKVDREKNSLSKKVQLVNCYFNFTTFPDTMFSTVTVCH